MITRNNFQEKKCDFRLFSERNNVTHHHPGLVWHGINQLLLFRHYLHWVIMLCQSWRDDRLQWHASDYEGLDVLHVSSYAIWQPDLVLINK